jgi:hypothetical protein
MQAMEDGNGVTIRRCEFWKLNTCFLLCECFKICFMLKGRMPNNRRW